MAVFDAINSSSDGEYGLAFAFAMSCVRRAMSSDPDAMFVAREDLNIDSSRSRKRCCGVQGTGEDSTSQDPHPHSAGCAKA
jgi:hypothetical protein